MSDLLLPESVLPAGGVLGIQEPRIWRLPEEFDQDLSDDRYDDLVGVADLAGLILDPWQEYGAESLTLTRSDGKWAAFEDAIIASRQNGKGSIIEARQLAGLFVWGEELQVYTAHEFKTAQEMFMRIRQLVEGCPDFDRMVARIRTADGEEGIETTDGRRLQFLARTGKSGRGFTGDTVYLDESFAATTKMLGALMPTMSARSIFGNPQIIYASSQEHIDSAVQRGLRCRAEATAPVGRMGYLEWSSTPFEELPEEIQVAYGSRNAYYADPKTWAQANPALGIRISVDFVQSEWASMQAAGAEDEFGRERLSIPERTNGEAVISSAVWAANHDDDAELLLTEVAFAVDVPPSRDSAVITMAGRRSSEDEKVSVVVIDQREGTDWVVDRLKELDKRWRPVAVVWDPGSAAGSLGKGLENARLRRLRPVRSVREYTAACGVFYDLAKQGDLRHTAQEQLNRAVDGAAKRFTGGDDAAWAWSRRNASVDISPLVSATLAVSAVAGKRRRKPGESSRRQAVLLRR